MFRERLRRWAQDAVQRALDDRDSAGVRVFSAPWLLPGDGPPLRDGAVAVDDDGRVLQRGGASELRARFPWAQSVEADGILVPGLVDAHANLELGSPVDAPRGPGLRRWIRTLRELREETEALDPASREARVRAAVARSLRAGSAAVGELSDTLRAVPAMARAGLWGAVFHSFGQRGALTARGAAKALAAAAVERAGIVPWPEGIRYLLGLHGDSARAGSVSLRGWSAEPAPAGGLPGASFAHVARATRQTAARLARDQASVLLCPRTDLRVAGRLPHPVPFLEEGCRLALGTGSPAASPEGSVLREAAELFAAFPEVPALALLNAATSGGADALGLPTLGALEPGRAPGLLLADCGGRVPDDPANWLLREGEPELRWLVRAAPPALS
jgi:5-methylthioadenosine/S-adenosylhomocysteine deaminase